VSEPEQLGEMQQRAGTFLTAYHDEMVLQSVEPGQEYDSGLVEPCRRLKNVPRERDRGLENSMEALNVTGRKACKARRSCRCDRVENAQQRVRIAFFVAGDQFGVVEIVAGIHPYVRRQLPPHLDFLLLREQRDLHAVDLRRIVAKDA